MLSVKTRKVGNSIAISIPKQLGVEANKEFVVYQSKNGGLIFAPKLENPYASNKIYEASGEDEIWQQVAEEEISYNE